jgi:hypothetical protein
MNMSIVAFTGSSLGNLSTLTPDPFCKISVNAGDVLQIQVGSVYYSACPGPFTLTIAMEPRLPPGLVLDQSQSSWGAWAELVGANSLAQTFTPAVSGQCYSVVVIGSNSSGLPNCPITASLVEVVAELPGAKVLASSTVSRLTCALQEFTFGDSPVYLEAQKTYALLLSTCPETHYSFRCAMSDAYTAGELFQLVSGGWQPAYLFGQPTPTLDLVFSTYMVPGIPPVRLDSPASHSSLRVGDSVQVSAVLAPDVPLPVSIDFYANGELIGQSASSPYAITWVPARAGSVALTASLTDAKGQNSTSKPVNVDVKLVGPANDDFAFRTVLNGDYASLSFSTAGATLEFNEPQPFTNSLGTSLWWSWTAPRSGYVSVEVLDPDWDNAGVAIYTGSALGTLQTVTDAVGQVSFLAAAGKEYAIEVDALSQPLVTATLVVAQSDLEINQPAAGTAFTAPAGITILAGRTSTTRTLDHVELYANDTLMGSVTTEPYTFTIQLTEPGEYQLHVRAYDGAGVATDSMAVAVIVRPQNDDYENAIVLTGYAVTTATSNMEATMQCTPTLPWEPKDCEPEYADNQGGHSIWYKWTAPDDGFCVLSGSGNGFGLLLGAYRGTSVKALSLLGVNALNGGGPVGFTASAGTTYSIAVDGGLGEQGSLVWSLKLRPRNDDFAWRPLIDGSTYQVITSFQGAGLESEGASPLFVSSDFLDVPGLSSKLAAPLDSVSTYLWGQLSSADQVTLLLGSTSEQLSVLLANFNQMISQGLWLYDYSRFAGIPLSLATADLLAQFPNGAQRSRLTRLLLQDAYPQELGKLPAAGPIAPQGATSSLWWWWKAPISGTVSVSAVSASTDSQIAVFTGDTETTLNPVIVTSTWAASNSVTFTATEGSSYQVAVFGHMSQQGSFTFSLSTRGTRLLNPLDGTVFSAPARIEVRAEVEESAADVAAVEFYANGALLGSVSAAPYAFVWDNVQPGTYRLAARSQGAGGTLSSSPPAMILVGTGDVGATPKVFAGAFANCSYVVDALGELRIFGCAANQFGLNSIANLSYPQLAPLTPGVDLWSWIGAGSQTSYSTWEFNWIPFPSYFKLGFR